MSFLVGSQNVLEGNDALQPPKVSAVDNRQEGDASKPPQRHIQGVVWMDVDEGQRRKKASDHYSALSLGGRPLERRLGDPVPFSVAILDKEKLSRSTLKARECVGYQVHGSRSSRTHCERHMLSPGSRLRWRCE